MNNQTIDYIESVRSSNNMLWMRILKIALKYSPAETKELLRDIKTNDDRISEATGRIIDED